MKVLHLNIYFELPDDFQGTFNDALREYIKYRESKNLEDIPTDIGVRLSEDKPYTEYMDDMWIDFLDGIEQGKKVTGDFALTEWTGNEWIERNWIKGKNK